MPDGAIREGRLRFHDAKVIAAVTFLILSVTAGWIATVPPTVKLTSQAFGRENTGVIYGWIAASHQLGASMAAFGAGAIRAMAGGYQLALWIAGILYVLAGAAFLTVGRQSFAGAARQKAMAAVPA